jgi:16S rRNA (cytidine1402-2'-O)-methyltransferase
VSGEGRPPGSPQESGAGRPQERAAAPRTGDGSAPAGSTPWSGGRLFIVATPIGNLGDVTYRAVEVLRTVPLVAAEDTRLTRRLFARYEIATPLTSYHAQSGPGRETELLEHLRAGHDLALVTDAGTPLVSDPGGELAAAWTAEGGAVIPIPGASAVLAALVASGLPAARFAFEGFLPRSGRERRERLARIANDARACVIYEAPGRVPRTLADLATAVGEGRRAAVCRELTKIHEEVVRGPLGDLSTRASSGGLTLRGEFAIVLEALAEVARPAGSASVTLEEGRAEVERLVAGGTRRADAVRQVVAATGLDRRELYRPG